MKNTSHLSNFDVCEMARARLENTKRSVRGSALVLAYVMELRDSAPNDKEDKLDLITDLVCDLAHFMFQHVCRNGEHEHGLDKVVADARAMRVIEMIHRRLLMHFREEVQNAAPDPTETEGE